VDDAADDASIICSLDAAHIRWQVRFNTPPLIIAQPKQILAHGTDPSGTNQIGIVPSRERDL
jgi:hypothetical protein